MQHSDIRQININDSIKTRFLQQGLERLPHALLLTGPTGVGKLEFAEELARLLLCEAVKPGLAACGACEACRWQNSGNHPDYRRVAPDETDENEEGKSRKRSAGIIRIDQIRELESFVFVGSHRNGRRVVLVAEADAMNGAAANALLKILEEPPPSVYFLLVSSRIKSLLPTIRSRCRVVPFAPPDAATAADWLAGAGLGKQAKPYLALAGGAPLRVVQWQEQGQLAPIDTLIDSLISPPADPLVLAAKWDALLRADALFSVEHLIEGIQRWLFDLVQERMAGEVRYHGGWSRPGSVSKLQPEALLAAWREFAQFRRSARHPLNQLLFLENLAAHYLRAVRPVAA